MNCWRCEHIRPTLLAGGITARMGWKCDKDHKMTDKLEPMQDCGEDYTPEPGTDRQEYES